MMVPEEDAEGVPGDKSILNWKPYCYGKMYKFCSRAKVSEICRWEHDCRTESP